MGIDFGCHLVLICLPYWRFLLKKNLPLTKCDKFTFSQKYCSTVVNLSYYICIIYSMVQLCVVMQMEQFSKTKEKIKAVIFK